MAGMATVQGDRVHTNRGHYETISWSSDGRDGRERERDRLRVRFPLILDHR